MLKDSSVALSGERRLVFAEPHVREAELVKRERAEENRAAWDSFIDRCLVEWGRNSQALQDDDFIPPDTDVIQLACEIALGMRDEGVAPPTMVVPDGEGGVSFERIEGNVSASLNIHADSTVELLVFEDCRLSQRRHLL
ncbi:MAG: hypothetical protein GX591_16150 [Planctomycetes bacterium]|nr:hypothetical protein [Planctomycetota bacterium]